MSVTEEGEGIVFSSLASLLNVQTQVNTLSIVKRKIVRSRHIGSHHSVFKGRGMDFAESRLYQVGDDIRTIDWRVTARTGKVHTKVFEEEREKPVLIWLDLRPAMFFATRGRFKSVLAAEVAALLLWKTLEEGDRAGGFIQAASKLAEFKPARNRSSALHFMKQVAQTTRQYQQELEQAQPAAMNLQDSWVRLRRVSEQSGQIFLISDFRGVDQNALQQLARIRRQAAVILIVISDPLEQRLPERSGLSLTDGKQRIWVNLLRKRWRADYLQRHQQAQAYLQRFAVKHQMPLISLSTEDDSKARLLKLTRGLR